MSTPWESRFRQLLFAALAMLLSMCPFAAQAWDVPVVRVTCIPEGRFLRLEHHVVSDGVIYHDDARQRKRLERAWEKRGYHQVDRFRQTCALPGATYRIRIDREPYRQNGQCSQNPRINITLLRNGVPVLKEVPYGDDCYGGVALTSLEIREDAPGLHAMRACLALPHDTLRCQMLDAAYELIGIPGLSAERRDHPPLDRGAIERMWQASGAAER